MFCLKRITGGLDYVIRVVYLAVQVLEDLSSI